MYHTLDLHFQNYEHAIAAFCIESSNGLILIESGPFSTFKSLAKGLNTLGYSINDVKNVLLTHIHFDHAGAAWAFAEKNSAWILEKIEALPKKEALPDGDSEKVLRRRAKMVITELFG